MQRYIPQVRTALPHRRRHLSDASCFVFTQPCRTTPRRRCSPFASVCVDTKLCSATRSSCHRRVANTTDRETEPRNGRSSPSLQRRNPQNTTTTPTQLPKLQAPERQTSAPPQEAIPRRKPTQTHQQTTATAKPRGEKFADADQDGNIINTNSEGYLTSQAPPYGSTITPPSVCLSMVYVCTCVCVSSTSPPPHNHNPQQQPSRHVAEGKPSHRQNQSDLFFPAGALSLSLSPPAQLQLTTANVGT